MDRVKNLRKERLKTFGVAVGSVLLTGIAIYYGHKAGKAVRNIGSNED